MSASDEVLALLKQIRHEFAKSLSLLTLKILDDDFEIPEDISHIQNIHVIVVQDLEALKKGLESHIGIVEKTELIMNILDYKLYESQFSFRTQFDSLKERKESLTKLSITESQGTNIALKVVEIDDEISKLEESHQKNLEGIKEEKLEAQKAYERAVQVMDQNFEKMSTGLNKLMVLIEAQKASLSESQAQLVDSKFAVELEQFRSDIERYTELQTTGWKILYPEERISGSLRNVLLSFKEICFCLLRRHVACLNNVI